MKKTLLATALIAGVLASGSALAFSTNLGNIKVNVNTPAKTTTNANKEAAKAAATAKMKSQIDALNNQINTVSTNYKNAVTDLTNNLLPADTLAKYKEEVAKLKSKESGAELNIDIAEDGTIALNKAIKNNAITNIKNLNATKKAAIQNDFTKLKNACTSYTSISAKAAELAASIKDDPMTALSLHSEITGVIKNGKEAAKQAKNISSLTTNLSTALAKSGLKLK